MADVDCQIVNILTKVPIETLEENFTKTDVSNIPIMLFDSSCQKVNLKERFKKVYTGSLFSRGLFKRRLLEALSSFTRLPVESIVGDELDLTDVLGRFLEVEESVLANPNRKEHLRVKIDEEVLSFCYFRDFIDANPLWDKCIHLQKVEKDANEMGVIEVSQEDKDLIYRRAQEATNIPINTLKDFFTLKEAQLIPGVMKGERLDEEAFFIRAGLVLFDISFNKACVGILPVANFRRPTNHAAAHVYSVRAELLHGLCEKFKIREVWDGYGSLLENKKAFWNVFRATLGKEFVETSPPPETVTIAPLTEPQATEIGTDTKSGIAGNDDLAPNSESTNDPNRTTPPLTENVDEVNANPEVSGDDNLEPCANKAPFESATELTIAVEDVFDDTSGESPTDFFLYQKDLKFKDVLKSINPDAINFYTPRLSLGGLYGLSQIYTAPTALHLYLMHGNERILSVPQSDLVIKHQLVQSRNARACKKWLEAESKGVSQISSSLPHMPSSSVTFTQKGQGGYLLGNQELTRDFLGEGSSFETVLLSKNTVAAGALQQQMGQLPWEDVKKQLLEKELNEYTKWRKPEFIYYLMLWHLFKDHVDSIFVEDADFPNTKIWETLFEFQRDGAISILNKLEKHGGCILADSVGLGKTYTALAVIMAYQRMGKNVAVFCPKRLEENWKRFKSLGNDNPFRDGQGQPIFRYQLFRHTHLKDGTWQQQAGHNLNFSLFVIDESHNFRNDSGARYRFLQMLLAQNKNAKILMLTATPINNRVKDLQNQLKLLWHIPIGLNHGELYSRFKNNIEAVIDDAHGQIQHWQERYQESGGNVSSLSKWLPDEYFNLLKRYIVARDVSVIRSDYPLFINEKGNLPEEKWLSVTPKIAEHISITDIVKVFEKLRLIAYDQEAFFKNNQAVSHLLGMLKIGFLKRFESSVASARRTLDTLIQYMETTKFTLERASTEQKITIKRFGGDALDDYVDVNDDEDENTYLLQGKDTKAYKITLAQRDAFCQIVGGDIEKLKEIKRRLNGVTPEKDLKLQDLKERIKEKMQSPIKKILIFTAYKDTADYLYENLSAMDCVVARLTGAGGRINRTGLANQSEILRKFAPIGQEYEIEKRLQINVLIATDCISEGQNLQDCDMVVNYDIHWNPVRVIQRNGRINRIGSPHKNITIINYWPMEDIESYLNVYTRFKTKTAIGGTITTGQLDVDKETFFQNQRLREILEGDPSRWALERAQQVKIYDTRPFLTDYKAFCNKKENEDMLKDVVRAPLGIYSITSQALPENVLSSIIFLLRKKKVDVTTESSENYKLVMIDKAASVTTSFTPVFSETKIFSRCQKLCVGNNHISADQEKILEICDVSKLEALLRNCIKQKHNNFDLDKYTLATYLIAGDVRCFLEESKVAEGRPSVAVAPNSSVAISTVTSNGEATQGRTETPTAAPPAVTSLGNGRQTTILYPIAEKLGNVPDGQIGVSKTQPLEQGTLVLGVGEKKVEDCIISEEQLNSFYDDLRGEVVSFNRKVSRVFEKKIKEDVYGFEGNAFEFDQIIEDIEEVMRKYSILKIDNVRELDLFTKKELNEYQGILMDFHKLLYRWSLIAKDKKSGCLKTTVAELNTLQESLGKIENRINKFLPPATEW